MSISTVSKLSKVRALYQTIGKFKIIPNQYLLPVQDTRRNWDPPARPRPVPFSCRPALLLEPLPERKTNLALWVLEAPASFGLGLRMRGSGTAFKGLRLKAWSKFVVEGKAIRSNFNEVQVYARIWSLLTPHNCQEVTISVDGIGFVLGCGAKVSSAPTPLKSSTLKLI